jgi:hypothetical protein
MPVSTKLNPKRVVYLWGAGATHAEAQRLGSTVSLLMRDSSHSGEGITTRILRRTGKKVVSSFSGEEAGNVDIEKLISLLAGSGTKSHADLAERLRENYFAELKASLYNAKILDNPDLAVQLFKMHNNSNFQRQIEVLTGIISTNHDGLLQLASQQVYDGINPGIRFDSDDYKASESAPQIIQLHGSFTWQFGMPMKVIKLHRKSSYKDTVWIPPTILKETKNYPYNKLSGLAYELLARHCDVLRVVGTSLTQNDWNVLSLIFNAQRHREITKGEPFVVELIMPQEAGEQIKKDCAYLKNVISIEFLTEGRFAEYKTPEKIPVESDLNNPFAYWLSQKQEFHRNQLRARSDDELVAVQIGAPA